MLRVYLGPVTEVHETTKDKLDVVCGNNEKYQVLYWRAVFLLANKCEDCDLS